METIIIFALISIAQLSIYIYQNGDLKFKILGRNQKELKQRSSNSSGINKKDIQQAEQGILSKNLKHLEFISQFETYLEADNAQNFSVEFLQEFEAIKRKAQVSTLKSAQLVKHKVAA